MRALLRQHWWHHPPCHTSNSTQGQRSDPLTWSSLWQYGYQEQPINALVSFTYDCMEDAPAYGHHPCTFHTSHIASMNGKTKSQGDHRQRIMYRLETEATRSHAEIEKAGQRHLQYPPGDWAGVRIESGTDPTTSRWNQAKSSARFTHTPWNLSIASMQFHFRDTAVPGYGVLCVHSPIPGASCLVLDWHVVKADVPFFLGLYAPGRVGITVAFRWNQLSSSDP